MEYKQRSEYDNRIVSLGEFDANKRNFRRSAEEIYDAVNFCDDLRSESFWFEDAHGNFSRDWDPLEEDSDPELVDDLQLLDYFYELHTGATLDSSPESDVRRNEFMHEISGKVRVLKEVAAILLHLLNTKQNKYESHSQLRLRAIIEEFKQKFSHEEVFAREDGEVLDRLYMFEISEFMEFYKHTVLSERKYDETRGYEVVPVDVETYEHINQARSTFIAGLSNLHARGIITETQLARAVQICKEIDIKATDPLSEVYYKRPDTEEFGIGYFMPDDRAIFINSDLIRHLGHVKHSDESFEFQQEQFRRAVIKTVYHELFQ